MKDFTRLAEIVKVVQPGLIYANKLGAFGHALNAISLASVELVTSQPCDLARLHSTNYWKPLTRFRRMVRGCGWTSGPQFIRRQRLSEIPNLLLPPAA
jgi:hypothetical protein